MSSTYLVNETILAIHVLIFSKKSLWLKDLSLHHLKISNKVLCLKAKDTSKLLKNQ